MMEAVLRLPRLSLSAWILIGLGLGIFTGLFFGESATALQTVADIYIRLMQMTVLPYLVLALMIGFGQLEAEQAKRLAKRAGALLLLTWGLTFGVIALLPAAFPDIQTASFFSNALVEPGQPFSIPDVYFTANPFNSLANAAVPAVVLFSSMLGIGLIGMDERERLLAPLRVVNAAVVSITRFVIRLTPVGVFAIGAVTAGTMAPDTLQRLEVYFVAFAAASLVLGFVILPLLVTAMTPFTYRDVMWVGKDALITAFVASNAFIVLPVLVERSKALLEKRGLLNAESDSAAEILIPILFNFPNAGRLLTLLFVPFAAWLAGSPLAPAGMAKLAAVGIPSYFAKAQVALPFLLDVFKLPQDLFQLYIPTTIITGKFDSMVTAMNLLVFALLGAGAMSGFLEVRRKRVVTAGIAMLTITAVMVVGVRALLVASIDTAYHRDEALRRMQASRSAPSAIVHKERPVQDAAPAAGGGSARARPPARHPARGLRPGERAVQLLQRRRAAGRLRRGARPEPGGVARAQGRVRAGHLAGHARDARRTAQIDVMPGIWVRPYWFSTIHMSAPYFTGTVGLVVRDERREEFADARRAAARARPEGGRAPRRLPAGGQPAALLRRQPRGRRHVRQRGGFLREAAPGDRRVSDARGGGGRVHPPAPGVHGGGAATEPREAAVRHRHGTERRAHGRRREQLDRVRAERGRDHARLQLLDPRAGRGPRRPALVHPAQRARVAPRRRAPVNVPGRGGRAGASVAGSG